MTEVLVVVVLLLLNGAFAMSELAILSSRRVRLAHRAERGDSGARAALGLVEEPTRFLSAVQVGITLVGILTGVFGGATIGDVLTTAFEQVAVIAPYAEELALAIVVVVITYFSLVIGELVPKRIALANPERIAAVVARPMRGVAWLASPLVTLLTGSTNLVMRVLRLRLPTAPVVTEAEIRALVEEGTESGEVQAAEHEIVESVFRLGDRQVVSIMTPRQDVEWLDVDETPEDIRRWLAARRHPRAVVAEGSLENILGIVYAEDLLGRMLERGALELPGDLRQVITPPLFVPTTTPVYQLLDRFRKSRQHVAIVLDEFGGVEGLVTLNDIVEALVGSIPARGDAEEEPAIVERSDGSWLVDGSLPLEDIESLFPAESPSTDERRGFRTVAGFVLSRLGRVPVAGDHASWNGMRFEVVDMDGRRIDKVLIAPEPPEAT